MDEFYKIIKTDNTKPTRKDFTKEKINEFINILRCQNNIDKRKKSLYYYVRRHFAIKLYKDSYVLIDKKKIDSDNVIPYIYFEEIYDTLKTAHLNSLHGGIKKTFEYCKKYAANIKKGHVEAFISICDICNANKQKRKNKLRSPTKKIISSGFGDRGQVDLIDIQKILNDFQCTDKRWKYILNYQDHYTKFCFLRGLRDKKAETIIKELKDIFLIIGAPKLLQTDNGGEFVNNCFSKYIATFWPDSKHIKGSPYHPQSQGSVERANGDVKRMLKSILANESKDTTNNEGIVINPVLSATSSIHYIIAWILHQKHFYKQIAENFPYYP